MSKKIAVIGECMLELSTTQEANTNDTRAKQNNVKALSAKRGLGVQNSLPMALSYGGDTLNTAVYLARLGANVEYLTALGDDAYSDWMLQQWRAENVGCDSVVRLPARLPGLYAIETDSAGERRFHYWRNQAPARELFDDAQHRPRLFQYLSSCDLLYLSGITLSLYQSSTLKQLFTFLQYYRQQGGRVAFDSNYRPVQWPDEDQARATFRRMYQLTDIALPTLDDELLLYPQDSAEHVIARLRELGVAEIVLKQGKAGCLVANDEGCELLSVNQVVQAIDTTAAGDSFNAAYLAARLRGESCSQAGSLGHALAAKVIQYPGAIIPREVMQHSFMPH